LIHLVAQRKPANQSGRKPQSGADRRIAPAAGRTANRRTARRTAQSADQRAGQRLWPDRATGIRGRFLGRAIGLGAAG